MRGRRPVGIVATAAVLVLAGCTDAAPAPDPSPSPRYVLVPPDPPSIEVPTPDARLAARAAIDGLVAGDRETFFAAGTEPDGTLLVSIVPGADEEAATARIRAVAAGQRFQVRRCPVTSAEWDRITAELPGRKDLRGIRGFGMSVHPARCKIELTGGIEPAAAAALREAYPGVVVIG